MRERKFRGLDNMGYWVYGDLIQYESGETAILNRFSSYGSEATEITRRSKVNPETVGQFTGLKDKNDTDIYEGDVLEASGTGGDLLKVFFNTCTACYDIEWMGGDCEPMVSGEWNAIDYDVIGNIHENPALMMEARECK